MTNSALPNVTLPAEKEIEAAVQGHRALTAFLATGFETQCIQISDEKNQPHQVELPTSALRLLVDISPNCQTVMPSEWYRCMPS